MQVVLYFIDFLLIDHNELKNKKVSENKYTFLSWRAIQNLTVFIKKTDIINGYFSENAKRKQ